MTGKKILVGRPRLSVDFAIVLRMRDVENLGWSRMAEAYPGNNRPVHKPGYHQAQIPGSKSAGRYDSK